MLTFLMLVREISCSKFSISSDYGMLFYFFCECVSATHKILKVYLPFLSPPLFLPINLCGMAGPGLNLGFLKDDILILGLLCFFWVKFY